MPTEGPNGTQWQMRDHERRIGNLERLELSVLVNRVTNVEKRVDGLTKALWATAGALLVAAVSVALTFAGHG